MKIAGMETDDLTVRELVGELSDLKKDLRFVEQAERGELSASELSMYSMYTLAEKPKLTEAIAALEKEIEERKMLEDE
jgi:hypothetical protein